MMFGFIFFFIKHLVINLKFTLQLQTLHTNEKTAIQGHHQL